MREEMDRQPRTIIMSTHHLHESEKLLDTLLYLDSGRVQVNGPVEDLAEQILEIIGAPEEVDRVLNRIGAVPELSREQMSIGRRSVIDLRGKPQLIDATFDAARQVGGRVRITEVTLEQAVLAMGGQQR